MKIYVSSMEHFQECFPWIMPVRKGWLENCSEGAVDICHVSLWGEICWCKVHWWYFWIRLNCCWWRFGSPCSLLCLVLHTGFKFLYWHWLIDVSADLQQWRLMCLAVGFVLLLLAPIVSSWVPFYYSTSMAIGVFLVIIILLFQVCKFGFVAFRSSSPFFNFSLCQHQYHQIGLKCRTKSFK